MSSADVHAAVRPPCRAPGAAIALALCGLFSGLMPLAASAALGDTEASVSTDSVKLKAVLRMGATPGAVGRYTVHELQLPAGTVVREFVSSAGVVFAVAWQGPFKPDMRQLLGRYFDTYNSAPRIAGSSRARLAIDAPDLVIRAGGHMRAFSGLAYAPQLTPAGVSAGDLQ